MSSKTEAVRRRVFEAILRGDYSPGERIPAEREMASMTGTSRVTVRRAYGVLEKSGIIERRQGSGAFIPTRARANDERADTVAVLASLRDPFAVEFVEAMERSLAEQGVFLVLRLTEQDPELEARAAMDLVGLGVRNLVVWASGARYDRDLFARLRILGANMVFFDRMLGGEFADYVGLENRHAVGLVVSAAVKRGARRAVFVSHDGLGADSDREREEAFAEACERRGISHELARVPWRGDVQEALAASGPEWFEAPSKLAVACVNDEVAMEVKRFVPQLDVYGIDGLGEATECGITSVRQPMAPMARAAVEMLFEQQRAGAHWRPTSHYIRGKLVEGDGH